MKNIEMDQHDIPLISIITVVYNGADTLECTIKSVLNQTYSNIEYIIIDGKSTDGSVDIIQKYNDQISFWISEKDAGIYAAMNKGIEHCNGELIGIINSDDWYENDTIEKVVKSYLLYPQTDIFHGLLRFYSRDNVVNAVLGYTASSLGQNMIQHPTCFVKKSVYELYGKFNTDYRSGADYEFMLRLFSKKNISFYFIEEILANFREGGISFSANSLREDYLIKFRYGQVSFLRFLILSFYLRLKEFFQNS